MPKAYFEPQVLVSLGEVLRAAQVVLKARGEDSPANLDWVARNILELASNGLTPPQILAEIVTPLSPLRVGLKKSEIRLTTK